MSSTILLVDDEPQILEILSSYLTADGFHVLTATRGQEALDLVDTYPIGLIVLDLMLPDVSGEEVCQTIRLKHRTPILMLTAKSGEAERIHGLSIGADDYLVKPFSPRELVARVRAIMRRSGDYKELRDQFQIGDLSISLHTAQVLKNGQPVDLTPNEYRLLITMAKHPGRIWTREDLITEVLGFDYEGNDRTIDTHIKNVRQKIETDPRQPDYIKTIYGMGYRLDVPESKQE